MLLEDYWLLRQHLNKLRHRMKPRRKFSRFPSYGRVTPAVLRRYLDCSNTGWKQVLAASGVKLRWVRKQKGMPPRYVGLNKLEAKAIMTAWYAREGLRWRKRLKI